MLQYQNLNILREDYYTRDLCIKLHPSFTKFFHPSSLVQSDVIQMLFRCKCQLHYWLTTKYHFALCLFLLVKIHLFIGFFEMCAQLNKLIELTTKCFWSQWHSSLSLLQLYTIDHKCKALCVVDLFKFFTNLTAFMLFWKFQ